MISNVINMLGSVMTEIRTTPVSGPAVWIGRDVSDPAQWTRHFDETHRRELKTLLPLLDETFEPAKAKADFPQLATLLDDVHRDLTQGRGFVRVRGFPIDHYALEETEK